MEREEGRRGRVLVIYAACAVSLFIVIEKGNKYEIRLHVGLECTRSLQEMEDGLHEGW